jgi:eukaryotic-like serine/threonine-protein kinase
MRRPGNDAAAQTHMKFDFQRLERVLAEAASKSDPAERAAFLETACGGDEAFRAEVGRLLAASEEAGDFLEAAVEVSSEQVPVQQTKSSAVGVAMDTPGTLIGRYKLLEGIGEGGFGVVYMAEQLEPVQTTGPASSVSLRRRRLCM